MAKEFKSGVDSILGGSEPKKKEPKEAHKEKKAAGPGDEMTIATFKISKNHLKKIRILSALIEKEQKDILFEALEDYFSKYEKENGKIPA